MKSNNTTKVPLSPRELQAVNHILITWGTFTLLELGGDLNFLPKNTLARIFHRKCDIEDFVAY